MAFGLKNKLTLARYMAPWSGDNAPDCPEMWTEIAGAKVQVFGDSGALLIIGPGLHFLGPDDLRLRRVAKILAASGFLVFAPYVEDYLQLKVTKSALQQFDSVCNDIHQKYATPATILAFSFGSLLALKTAATSPKAVKRMILFGGLTDFLDVMNYSVYGFSQIDRSAPTIDKLNRGASYINYAPYSGKKNVAALQAAWLEFCRTVWNRDYHNDETVKLIGEQIAGNLPASYRKFFMQGAGLLPPEPGIIETMKTTDMEWAQPWRYAQGVSCDVTLIHSSTDNVVPAGHALKMHELLTNSSTHIMGSFAHAGRNKLGLGQWLGEIQTMAAVVKKMTPQSEASNVILKP